jgi:hypothetical protein
MRSFILLLWLRASRVRSTMASLSHSLTAVMMFSVSRPPAEASVERLRYGDRCYAASREAFQERGQVLDAADQQSSFATMTA